MNDCYILNHSILNSKKCKIKGIVEPVSAGENILFNPLIESSMSPFIPGPSTSAASSPSIYHEDIYSTSGQYSSENLLSASTSASTPLHLQDRQVFI